MYLREKASELVSQMTLSEKASLSSGKDVWYLKGIPRLGLPEQMATDGSAGLRKQEATAEQMGISNNVPAVCFPSPSAVACSFDRDLWYEIGKAIGEECRQENVGILNGPGINIKRSPLCGRNFEYYSEDPYLSGEAATAFITGVQSQGVGVALKHFAANNQEKRRMTVESVMDERTLREIYLPAFEAAVKNAKPWTLMGAFNRLFGEQACENKRLLTDILRHEWGFEGVVMSDWGAVIDRVKALKAGLDLEMPHMEDTNDQRIVQAVENGSITLEEINTVARRVTELLLACSERQELRYDVESHRSLARRAAAQSAILLKNDANILPGNAGQKTAIIGAFAREPRYQGMGAAKVNPIKLDNAYEELKQMGLEFDYAAGYRMDVHTADDALIAEACQVAAGKEVVFIFAGLPGIYESEGADRKNMSMPESHVALIKAVSKVNGHVVVLLHGGAPMEMNWADQVQGILLLYVGGEAVGSACADLLLGKAIPGGKLAESWPFTDVDSPTHDFFPGYPLTVEYREGLFVGYRYYDRAKKPVRYPFGYGLSYTQFKYDNLIISAKEIQDTELLDVSCKVTNTGTYAGSEIVQLYVSCRNSVIIRPEQELKGFEKIFLEPGESRTLSFRLTGRDFAYYNVAIAGWHVESADYEVRISASSQDIRLSDLVHVSSTVSATLPDLRKIAQGFYDLAGGIKVSDEEFASLLGRPIPARERQEGSPHTLNSTMADIEDKFLGRQLMGMMRRQTHKMFKDDPDFLTLVDEGLRDLPVRFMVLMSGGSVSITQVEGLVEMLNGHYLSGLRMILKKKATPKKSNLLGV
jgi:beta-glucosidase